MGRSRTRLAGTGHPVSRIIQQPKKSLLPFPGLWLPGSPLPGAMGFARRCCCGGEGGIPCNTCSGTTPIQMEIVVPDHANGSCLDCIGFSGTFILDQITSCLWRFSYPADEVPCVSPPMNLSMTISTLSGPRVFVSIRWTQIGVKLRYEDRNITDFDCANWSALPIPFFPGPTGCTWDTSDLLLSAV